MPQILNITLDGILDDKSKALSEYYSETENKPSWKQHITIEPAREPSGKSELRQPAKEPHTRN